MTDILLRDGTTTKDRRLDRLVQFDERSRNFPIRTLVAAEVKKPRSYTWSCASNLDQGVEGACVGFAWAHELCAKPKVHVVTGDAARLIYRAAQKIDEWPGENYEGTSVLAGAKVVQGRMLMEEYRWGFSLNDLILGVGFQGPAVLGLNWYEGMFDTDTKGLIRPTGEVMGGHAIMCNGVNVTKRVFRLHNSWGPTWGQKGAAFISFDDMDRLLHEQGEACFPVVRR